MTRGVPDEVVEVYRAGKQAGGMGTGTAGPGPGLAAVFDRYGWPDRLSGPVPVSAPATPSPGAAGPAAASTAGARGVSGVCWECTKDRHGQCTGRDDPPPVGTGGTCHCPQHPAALVAFIRARLDDLAANAGAYHSDGARMPFPPQRCASLDYRGPCDCGEPNRRRRRAFTHGNLVDWAEQAAAVCDADGYNLDPAAVLRHLAAEWSDHPDYLTEWAP